MHSVGKQLENTPARKHELPHLSPLPSLHGANVLCSLTIFSFWPLYDFWSNKSVQWCAIKSVLWSSRFGCLKWFQNSIFPSIRSTPTSRINGGELNSLTSFHIFYKLPHRFEGIEGWAVAEWTNWQNCLRYLLLNNP